MNLWLGGLKYAAATLPMCGVCLDLGITAELKHQVCCRYASLAPPHCNHPAKQCAEDGQGLAIELCTRSCFPVMPISYMASMGA